MSKFVKNYFIGPPSPDEVYGQNSFGMVNCLVWGMIYNKGEFFAKPNEYSVGIGGGIGQVTNIPDGRAKIHDYAVQTLKNKKLVAQDLIKRINETLKKLGDDPANLEQFIGEYKGRN